MVFAGFYLDEIFTRVTFAVWPPRQLEAAHDPASLVRTTIIRSAS
jgi:hypothetical protein